MGVVGEELRQGVAEAVHEAALVVDVEELVDERAGDLDGDVDVRDPGVLEVSDERNLDDPEAPDGALDTSMAPEELDDLLLEGVLKLPQESSRDSLRTALDLDGEVHLLHLSVFLLGDGLVDILAENC